MRYKPWIKIWCCFQFSHLTVVIRKVQMLYIIQMKTVWIWNPGLKGQVKHILSLLCALFLCIHRNIAAYNVQLIELVPEGHFKLLLFFKESNSLPTDINCPFLLWVVDSNCFLLFKPNCDASVYLQQDILRAKCWLSWCAFEDWIFILWICGSKYASDEGQIKSCMPM